MDVRHSTALFSALLLSMMGVIASCSKGKKGPPELMPSPKAAALTPLPENALKKSRSEEPISALQPATSENPAQVALGKALFFEKRLSKDGSISCASCHILEKGGADTKKYSLGVGKAQGDINTPTVYNSGLNLAQFWDGRADTLEAQAAGPLTHPKEMANDWKTIIATVQRDQKYQQLFKDAYLDGINKKNLLHAIASFERTLITVNSPFDAYLTGDRNAISKEAREGYDLFKSIGCASCHQGRNAGGNMFQKFGVIDDYFKNRGEVTKPDYGRYNVTGIEADKHVFRVPSLRTVKYTAPYLHDGSVATLQEVVKIMGEYQLGLDLDEEQTSQITAFLHSLSGPLPQIAQPGL